MKIDVAVKLFSEAIKDDVSYPSYVGDDTTEHAEIGLKTPVYYEIGLRSRRLEVAGERENGRVSFSRARFLFF